MKNYALIGRRLSHSYSQRHFEELFLRLGLTDHSYTLHEMESLDSLRRWVTDEQINGFNVTVPFKQTIIPLLDKLSPEAKAIGAVNCVVVNDGRLIGHNTDAPAFRQTIQNSAFKIQHSFILGTGGAARAVAYALGQLGIPYAFVSRTPENHENTIGYSQLSTPDLNSQRHPRRHVSQHRPHPFSTTHYSLPTAHALPLRPHLQPIPHPPDAPSRRPRRQNKRWLGDATPSSRPKLANLATKIDTAALTASGTK
jgi:hypothetical protein